VTRAARTNPLALAVLVCLLEAPMHPYEMAQVLRSRAKHESVRLNFGSLYGVVESLERRGMVRVRETVRTGRRPERTIYEITDAGAREATDWLTDLLSIPDKEFPSFMAALSFLPALPPDEAAAALHRRTSALEVRLVQMRSLGQAAERIGLPRLFNIEGEYETALVQAELDFVAGLLADIEKGTLDGLPMWEAFHQEDPGPADPDPPDPDRHDPDPDPDPDPDDQDPDPPTNPEVTNQ
jgi:DNA-binding PadR family transcriptional regulator